MFLFEKSFALMELTLVKEDRLSPM